MVCTPQVPMTSRTRWRWWALPRSGRISTRNAFVRSHIFQLALDLVERELGHLEQDQPARTQTHDLAAQLRADGAAGAGHHDALVADAGFEELGVGWDGVAAQEIAYIDVTKLVDARLAGNDVGKVGKGLHVDAQRLEGRQDLPAAAAGGGRHGEQNALDAVPAYEIRQIFCVTHPQAVDLATLQRLLVVDEHYRLVVRTANEHGRQASARIAGAINGDASRREAVTRAGKQVANEEPAADGVKQRQRPVNGKRGQRQLWRANYTVVRPDDQNREADATHNREHRLCAHEPDDGAV